MKKILKWVGIVFVVLIIIGIFAGGNQSTTKKTEPAQKTPAAEAEPTLAEPMQITADDLADAFDENQVAAESEWGGKYVEFSAEISNITDTGISFHNVASKEFSLTQIGCRVKDKESLLPLKNGQVVKVRGTVGKQTVGVIDIKDCQVIQ